VEGSGRGLILRYEFNVLTRDSPGGTEENHENFSQDSRSPGRYLNSVSLEYEAGMLATRL
jgi:hypothetical protein